MYLLIVTGLSGAGKSLALRRLEEHGYFCVDNLPSPMLADFVKLCNRAEPAIRKAAVTVDSRESLLSRSSTAIISALDALDTPYEILFLDARDAVLKLRYNEVRRRHPLGDAGDAETGVARERVFLQPLRDRANYIVDTSDNAPRDFDSLIAKLLPEFESEALSIVVGSFGYKRGVPIDADIVYDMRFSPNPFYRNDLRPLSGLDRPVSDYVLSQEGVKEFLDGAVSSVSALLPLFLNEDKRTLRIMFGCTGGRHRSVAAAEAFARQLIARRGSESDYTVRIYHRDIDAEAHDIQTRSRY